MTDTELEINNMLKQFGIVVEEVKIEDAAKAVESLEALKNPPTPTEVTV